MVAFDLAIEYARNARNDTGQPYGPRYRKQLKRWWMNGWRGEPRLRGTNFDRPLENAWSAGQKAREESNL